MRILILGGNRFIGKILTQNLLRMGSINHVNQDNKITLFNRKGTGPSGCDIIQGDRNKIEDLEKIDFHNYDFIVDMCLYLPSQFKLMEPLMNINVKYIFMSSAASYKDFNYWPVNEESERGGMEVFGNYGKEKAEVEELIENSDIVNYRILRPTYIVGEGNHSPRIGHYISAIENNNPIEVAGNGENLINLVFAQDIIDCLLFFIISGFKSRTAYNLSSDEVLTVNSLIGLISRAIGKKEPFIKYNSDSAIFPYAHYGIFENKKIKKDYNIKFRTIEESLPSYIKWYHSLNEKICM